MPQFQIKFVKNKKEELEMDFKETMIRKMKSDSLKILGDEEWKEGKKGLYYKSVPSKELPEVLKGKLVKRGIDAYTYEPHPLIPGYRLNISGKNPKGELKIAIEDARKEWNAFGKLLQKKLK